jgi:nucleoside-triphosphatase THEP1
MDWMGNYIFITEEIQDRKKIVGFALKKLKMREQQILCYPMILYGETISGSLGKKEGQYLYKTEEVEKQSYPYERPWRPIGS